jgi:hypothetical protein
MRAISSIIAVVVAARRRSYGATPARPPTLRDHPLHSSTALKPGETPMRPVLRLSVSIALIRAVAPNVPATARNGTSGRPRPPQQA